MKEFKYGVDHLTSGIAIKIMRGEISGVMCDSAKQAVDRAHAIVVKVASQEAAVYGINTGFGPLCNTKIPKDQTTQLQHNLLISHSVGVGDPISQELSKLMLILKVNSLARGFSGISNEIIDRIIWHINNDVIPVVPEQGSVGASGDLAPLSHLFLPLLGEGELYYKNEILPTHQVFKSLNVSPVDMHPKSGLALINGTQFILAHAVMVVDTLYSCLAHADVIGGLMIEGLLGSASPFKKELHATRPYKGNIHVASRLSAFLKDSEILESHEGCDRVQDPYSLRCMPQVHGSSRHAWLHLKETVEVELNAVTDNPVVISEDEIISGGSFHGQPLAIPLDYACIAASEIGNISDRRSYFSLEGVADNTPKLLMKDTGINSGFMIVQYTAAALASENKGLCFPSSADSIPTSLGQEDHVSMGSIGGRKALQVCNNVIKILATELLCAAQAFDFKKPLKSSVILDAVHTEIRKHIDHATKDRIFALDINKAIEVIRSRVLLEIVEKEHGGTYSEHDDLFEKY